MPSPRPVLAGALVVSVCVAAAWASACGLSREGLGPVDDAGDEGTVGPDATETETGTGTVDGGGDDGGLSPSCTALDAACLGPLPSGWLPVTVSDAGCPPSFAPKTLRVNPSVPDGGCACGACQVTGSYTCTGGVAISGGDNCADPPIASASPGACTPAQAQHIEATPPMAAGNVTCFAPNDAGSGATTDSLTVCLPSCSADYCGAALRCVVAGGELPCPSGFTLYGHAGTGADPGCPACACLVAPPGPCTGQVTVYEDDMCDSGASATYAVGTCNQYSTSTDYQSVLVNLVAPDASCSTQAAAPGAGDASLTGMKTICCR